MFRQILSWLEILQKLSNACKKVRATINRLIVPKNLFSKTFLVHLTIALLLKIGVLSLFFFEIKKNNFFPTTGLFVYSNDTFDYFQPAENVLNGVPYGKPYRLPGMFPIYFPLRFLLNDFFAKNLFIVLQILTSSLSCVLLALIGHKFTKSIIVYWVLLTAYSLNTFVGVYDIFGLSDSFSVSFFIFGIFLFLILLEQGKIIFSVLSGLFFTWSFFLRPIMLVPFLVAGGILLIHFLNQKKKLITTIFLFFLPAILFTGIWVFRNFLLFKKFELLVKTDAFPEQYFEMIKLPVMLGMDFTWGYSGEWFIKEKYADSSIPVKSVYLTKSFNKDSLINLRKLYFESRHNRENQELKSKLFAKIELYMDEFKREHFLQYYFINPAKLFFHFLFPSRLDNLPLPPFHKMSFSEKIVKSIYYISLLLINFSALLYLFSLFFRFKQNIKKILFACIPFSIILVLVFVLGYIEQRYFAPVYPFFLMFAVFFIYSIGQKIIPNKIKNTFYEYCSLS